LFKSFVKREAPLHLMLIPGLALVVIFSYLPMAGIVIAFQDFIPAKGLFGNQKWVGIENFIYVADLPSTMKVVMNTLQIAIMKIVSNLLVQIAVALILNELLFARFKKFVQTIIYMPHFLSWIIISGMLVDILSPSGGIVNRLIVALGFEPIFFLGSNAWFPYILVLSEVWKGFGFGSIIFLAAITGIDPQLYEAARVDGASRLRQIWHITLPGIRMIIVLMCVLSLGSILNAGFDQVFNLYSPIVYDSGDIIDTMVYRMGVLDAQFGVATAVGLFQSLVSFILISIAYYLAYRLADYRIF